MNQISLFFKMTKIHLRHFFSMIGIFNVKRVEKGIIPNEYFQYEFDS